MRFGLDNLDVLEIKTTGDFTKDVDKADLDSNYFLEALGIRATGNSFIASRDFGTKNRFHVPPMRPNAHIVITGATNASPIVISTANTDGLAAGDTVYIDEVVGNTAANGTWVVGTVVANTSFVLVGSAGNGAYSSGGIWQSPDTDTARNPITITNGTTFYDKDTQTEYEIIVGRDSSGNTRVYVYDAGSVEASKWIELTRKFNALINEGAGIGAGDATFDIDTITENGVTFAFTDDVVNNWIVVNTAQSNETVLITDSSASNLVVDTIVGSSGLGWANNDTLEIYRFPAIKFNYTYDNGATPSFDWIQVEQQRKVTMLYTNSASPKVARQPIQIMRRDARNYFYSINSTALVTLAAGWYVESDYGVLNPYFAEQGTAASPISTNELGYTVTGATNATPIVISVASTTGLNNGDDIMVWGVQGNAGANGRWTIANLTGTTFELVNSVGTGAYTLGGKAYTLEISGNDKTIYDQNASVKRDWLSLFLSKIEVASGSTLNRAMRIMITGLYGYQESDPIFQGFYDGAVTNGVYIYPNMAFNFALMNKELTAINVYAATANDTVREAGWTDSPSEYLLLFKFEVRAQTQTANNRTTIAQKNSYQAKPYFSYIVNNEITSNTFSESEIVQNLDLDAALNHAIDRNRSYPTPKFVTKGTRDQGSIIAINEGDTKLHLSLYDGYGVHEDDNFPDVATDNNDNKMLVELFGTSELLGMEILYDTIFVFRNNLIETYDLQGVAKRSYLADVVSSKSIIATPYGIVYAGKSAIYFIPSDGGEIRVLNEDWESYYRGDDYVTGSTQYITDAYRAAIIGGYDETYREAYQVIQVNTLTSSEYIMFRYNFGVEKWTERRLNTTDTIKYFTKRQNDGTFTIGLSKGLLQYPNRTGSLQYEDDVRVDYAGTQYSRDKAVPMSFTLNIAAFNSQVIEKVLHGFIVDIIGESTNGGGMVTVEFYANDEDEPFDTQYVSVDRKMDYRVVERRGNIEKLAIAFTLPEDVIFKKFDASKITLGFVKDTKLGNL